MQKEIEELKKEIEELKKGKKLLFEQYSVALKECRKFEHTLEKLKEYMINDAEAKIDRINRFETILENDEYFENYRSDYFERFGYFPEDDGT